MREKERGSRSNVNGRKNRGKGERRKGSRFAVHPSLPEEKKNTTGEGERGGGGGKFTPSSQKILQLGEKQKGKILSWGGKEIHHRGPWRKKKI